MTLVGLLAFFGLAVVTVDVLGGFIAAGFLARGMKPSHLFWFVGGYTVSVIIATIILKPLLVWAGRLLAPVLDSMTALSSIELVIGLALVAVGIHQWHSANHPKPPKVRTTKDNLGALTLGGVAFSFTTFADPSFPIAVGMAMQANNLAYEIVLLVLWNVIYQIPLLTVTITAQFGWHERILAFFRDLLAPSRRVLLLILSGALLLGGALIAINSIHALVTHDHPLLEEALLLRKKV